MVKKMEQDFRFHLPRLLLYIVFVLIHLQQMVLFKIIQSKNI